MLFRGRWAIICTAFIPPQIAYMFILKAVDIIRYMNVADYASVSTLSKAASSSFVSLTPSYYGKLMSIVKFFGIFSQ